MNTNGLLALGVSEIVARSTGKLIGYAFTEPNGKGFLERWLLFTNPGNDFEVRPAPEVMTSWSLKDWQEKVPELWQSGAYYVWAQADVYRYGETYGDVTWTEIPPSTSLPLPSFPERPGASFQLDYTNCGTVCVRQNDVCGYGYVRDGLSRKSSVEYWLLPAAYAPAGSSCVSISPSDHGQQPAPLDTPLTLVNSNSTSSVGTACVADPLATFVALANTSWRPGAIFCITGCVNYQGASPPLVP